jgi:hypothetical protein
VALTRIVVAVVAIRVLAYRRSGIDHAAFFAYASLAHMAYLVPGVVLVLRRFNRMRYDAARTAQAFRVRVRGQTDVGPLVGDVVGATVQATSASVWLRSG